MKRSHKSSTTPRKTSRRSPKTKSRGAVPPDDTLMPKFVVPQLATLVTAVPEDSGWLHELKFDGYRLFCCIDNGRVSVLTRNAQDWTARFGALAQAAKQLPARQAIIDGEIVALNDDGSQDFQLLQNSLRDCDAAHLVYYAFDLLYLNGRDLRASPLLERKKLLQHFISRGTKAQKAQLIRYSEHWIGRGKDLFAEACNAGLEGIVAKRVDEPYRSGRSRSWLKIKCSNSQEFVIGGFTDPAGTRVGFGALLLGVHDKSGALRYAGRVGTGFDEQTLRELYLRLKKYERRSTPFVGALKGSGSGGVHWVEPKFVGEVVFAGWTSDGLLRHPSFKGLREDKPAGDISREVAATPPRK
jgi:bifunctional non-homologous end joining protein LigD